MSPFNGVAKCQLNDGRIVPMNQISKSDLLDKYICYCPQFFQAKNVSLREIFLTNNNITEEQGLWLLQMMCLDKWFKLLPEQWDTFFSDLSSLSGGERNRFKIALELAKFIKPVVKNEQEIDINTHVRYTYEFYENIVFLDETFDNIDKISQDIIMKFFMYYVNKKQLGLVIITHDLAPFRYVDYELFLFNNGLLQKSKSNYTKV
jgi:ABC-type transporter Mla maintaining outer membrane lipid asymmetry ATPase subunit MlaF